MRKQQKTLGGYFILPHPVYVLCNDVSVPLPHYICCVLHSLATIFYNQFWSPTATSAIEFPHLGHVALSVTWQ